LLGDKLDKKLQLYLRRIRDDGGPVTAGIAIAAARGWQKTGTDFLSMVATSS